ncbi:MAG: restriction endonuclease [Acidobacteriota bacterium]
MKDTFTPNSQLLDQLLLGDASEEEYWEELKIAAALVGDFATRFPPGHGLNEATKLIVDLLNNFMPDNFGTLDPVHRLWIVAQISQVFYWSHPEWILPLGFDQMRFNPEKLHDSMVSDDTRGIIDDNVNEGALQGRLTAKEKSVLSDVYTLLLLAPQFRTPNGSWHHCEFVLDRILPPEQEPIQEEQYETEEWLSRFRKGWVSEIAKQTGRENMAIYMPALRTPISNYPDIQLQNTIQGILTSIANEQLSLPELHWRTLEELVAELLYDSGLEVEITKRSWDGGRDIIAKGELFPGEPSVLAIEAKHMPVVPISELRAALWANREFPALLFVTSGRFSAGVYREKRDHNNVLRLYLKDGVALDQWIRMYARRHRLLINTTEG